MRGAAGEGHQGTRARGRVAAGGPWLGAGAALALLLSGCIGLDSREADDDPPEPTETAEATEAAEDEEAGEEAEEAADEDADAAEPDPDEPFTVHEDAITFTETVFDFRTGGDVDVEVTVNPLVHETVRDLDYLSLAIRFAAVGGTDDEPEYDIADALNNYALLGGPIEVRLLDARNMWVAQPLFAHDEANWVDIAEIHHDDGRLTEDSGAAWWTGTFDGPGSTARLADMAVLLPYFGLVEDVPVVQESEAADDVLRSLTDADRGLVLQHQGPWSLEIYREHVEDGYGTRFDGEETTLTVSSDLLFDIDSAELSDDADEALESASDEIADIIGGELLIVGHTDDVLDEEHNQELSEDRAESVHERLDELVDLDAFDDVTVEGRNFQEPVADNDTEDGRAQNRRVELIFTPADPPTTDGLEEDPDLELPEAEGPESTGGDPVEVTHEDGRTAEVTVEEMRRVGNVFVGRLTVEPTNLDEWDGTDDGASLAWPLSFGGDAHREGHGELNTGLAADAPTLMVGEARIFPLDYGGFLIEDPDSDEENGVPVRLPLSDRDFGGGWRMSEGAWATATVVWPAIDVDEVAVDVPSETGNVSGRGGEPWRISEVPVVSGED